MPQVHEVPDQRVRPAFGITPNNVYSIGYLPVENHDRHTVRLHKIH
jgi:hypothetical protein